MYHCSANWSSLSDIHALNGNCTSNGTLHHLGKLEHPITSFIYIVTAILCILFSIVTHLKYNRVTVLNLTVQSNVISNNAWIAYFIVVFVRSTLGAGIYGATSANENEQAVRLNVYFIADGVLKSLEIFCLLCALNHQWKYRSAGFLQQEIRSLNLGQDSESDSGSQYRLIVKVSRYKATTLFVAQFLLVILFLILLEALNVHARQVEALYWTYMALFWTQASLTIIWVISIVTNENEDGPTLVTKFFLAAGVFITLPGDIPSFVWSSCMKCNCEPWPFLTSYDFALFLLIPAVIIFFLVLRKEYLRLDQEAQYSVLGDEVDSLFSVHSRRSSEPS